MDMAELAGRLPGRSILIVGDVMLDEYVWGQVRRVSPEAPVPIVEARRRTSTPGGAANVAANVASLGGRALLAGAIGKDLAGEELSRQLSACRVDAEGLIVENDRMTITKTRIVAQSQQVVRVDLEQRTALKPESEDALLMWIKNEVAAADACILSDYGKGLVSPRIAQALIQLAQSAGKPVVVDPKGTDYDRYCGATVVTPNLEEAGRVLNREVDEGEDITQLGRDLLDKVKARALLITRGAEGMTLFEREGEPLHVPAAARQVYDVTGAGDTVTGTLALALAAGASLEEAVRLANAAAGIVVGKLGTATVTQDELVHAVISNQAPSTKVDG